MIPPPAPVQARKKFTNSSAACEGYTKKGEKLRAISPEVFRLQQQKLRFKEADWHRGSRSI